ncbi:MBL fold metallo-hydrolase [Kineococcus gynurae]|uniref:MBL fold metallo-hydrolase n=1 Tax=Kineococcus gynurae TaxID=452979 RepID=A0ABV5LRK8_9ACTN
MADLDTPATVQFVGTATTVIRWGPFTLLTDPNFLHRGQLAWLGHGLVTRRLTEPALGVEDLPDLDAVLLSHLHGDHFDRIARRGLDRGLPVVTTPRAARRLQALAGFRRAEGLRTWESRVLTRAGSTATITSLPARHARGRLLRGLLPTVMGSLLEFAGPDGRTAVRLYVSGDTVLFPGLTEIADRHPDLDAAVVHLGGTTLPGGAVVTLGAHDGTDLVGLLRPRTVLPVHHSDYGVFRSPIEEFEAAAARRGIGTVVTLAPGGSTEIRGRAA